MKIHLSTSRLIMRDLIPEDIDDIFELDSDPEVHRYLGENPIQSIHEAEEIIDHVRKQYEKNGIGRWAVIEKSSGEFLGWSGLKLEDGIRADLNYYDLGYRFKRKYWGQGFATESAIASLKYGFEKMSLHEICAAAHVDNLASNKILDKIGMKFIEQFYFEDQLCNWYSIVETDF